MSEQRNVALDGLRAFAVAAVLIEHGLWTSPDYFAWYAPGPFGVRLFFVLSGFLITGILLRARDASQAGGTPIGSVWRAFYARRALRIFPLAYLAMVVAWLAGFSAMRESAGWYVSYLANVKIAHDQSFGGGLGHFWSLAVEEQFYLVWPAVILALPRRWHLPIACSAIIGAGLLRVYYLSHGDQVSAYVLTTARFDALALGGVLALVKTEPRHWITAAALSILGALYVPALAESRNLAMAGLIVSAVAQGHGKRVLSYRPLVVLGTISYGVYVWHAMVPELVHQLELALDVWLRFPTEPGLLRFAILALLTLPLAWLSWTLFERPILSLKERVPYIKRDGGIGAARTPPHIGGEGPQRPAATPRLRAAP